MSRLAAIARQLRGTPALPAPPDPGFAEMDARESEIIALRLRRPILLGSAVVLILVFGLMIWAAISTITGAVVAPGTVRVENNTKVLKTREGGIIRQILVREGQRVQRGQVLLKLDQTETRASVDVWQAQYDSALADIARFEAQEVNAPTVTFPAELTSRASDPRVAALLAGQRALYQAQMLLYRSQANVLGSQAAQVSTQISGIRAQADAVDTESKTIQREIGTTKELRDLGYAPESRLLALQRSEADLKGRKGSFVSDASRAAQAIGGLRIQIAQLNEKRVSDAADGIRVAQDKLTDAAPKLRSARESLSLKDVRSPVDGYVFNLTQFTEGGVAQPGEALMQVVPSDQPLVISARVKPNDITQVRVGMPARVVLPAYNPRTTPPFDATVSLVAADATVDEATHEPYFLVQVKVDPAELSRAGHGIHLSPGMQAQVNIVTGRRTVMDYLLGPMTEAMRTALRER